MVLKTVKCSEVEWDMEPEDLDIKNLGQVPVTWFLMYSGDNHNTHLTGNCEMSEKIMKVEIFCEVVSEVKWKAFSHVRLCDTTDCSPPDSSVHGILQARILEWVAMPFSRGSSWAEDGTCIAGSFFTVWATREVIHTREVLKSSH